MEERKVWGGGCFSASSCSRVLSSFPSSGFLGGLGFFLGGGRRSSQVPIHADLIEMQGGGMGDIILVIQ